MKKKKAYNSNYKTYTELINRLEDVKNAIKKQNYGIAMDILCKPYPKYQIITSTEFKESEDEGIRKDIISFVEQAIDAGYGIISKERKEKWIAWLEKQGILMKALQISNARIGELIEKNYCLKEQLEKQGEQKSNDIRTTGYWLVEDIKQKPAWSEEDENAIHVLKDIVKYSNEINENIYTIPLKEKLYDWLKSIKDRVQPKQEWSEEDASLCTKIQEILSVCRCYNLLSPDLYKEMCDWLKSLRPQNWTKEDKERYISCLQKLSTGNPEQPETINSKWFKEHVYPQNQWKPSDEQIKALSYYIENYVDNDGVFGRQLVKLYHDLLILREENKYD